MLENTYQSILIKKIKRRFEHAVVFKTDPTYVQGTPDLIILYNDKWAALEVKKSIDAPRRPNQEYYINKFDNMSFARFIYPENEEEVLDELQRSFEA